MEHFKKYWWAYILGLAALGFIGYQLGLFGKKSSINNGDFCKTDKNKNGHIMNGVCVEDIGPPPPPPPKGPAA